MKKQVLIFSALAMSAFTFAQKSELKTAEKALKSGKTAEAKSAIAAAESLIASADSKTKAKFQLLKGKVNYDLAKKGDDAAYETAINAFNEVVKIEDSGKKTHSVEARQLLGNISTDLVNASVAANQSQNFDVAAKKLFMAYQLDKSKQDYLYFAATSAVSGKDYDKALEHYLELKDLGYTGVVTEYYATNVDTGEEERMQNQQQRDLFVKAKTHTNPTQRESESRLPEIVKNIALIYSQNGDTEKAVAAIKEARANEPEDINLLLTEANLYIKLDDKEKFKALMEEAVQKDPNNAVLYFNLGVINGEQGNYEEAKGYYEKAVEIDPNNKESYLNLASLLLSKEGPIVDEMNSLGNSRADNLRYDELKSKREGLYQSAIPYLEKILNIDGNDVDALRTLMNIYGTLGENEKFRELKGRLEALEQ